MYTEISAFNVISIPYDQFLRLLEPYYRMELPESILEDEVDMWMNVLPSYRSYVLGIKAVVEGAIDTEKNKNGASVEYRYLVNKKDHLNDVADCIKMRYESLSRRLAREEFKLRLIK